MLKHHKIAENWRRRTATKKQQSVILFCSGGAFEMSKSLFCFFSIQSHIFWTHRCRPSQSAVLLLFLPGVWSAAGSSPCGSPCESSSWTLAEGFTAPPIVIVVSVSGRGRHIILWGYSLDTWERFFYDLLFWVTGTWMPFCPVAVNKY